MTETEEAEYLAAIQVAAEGLLAEMFGGPVRMEAPEGQEGTRHRSRVLRYNVVDAPSGSPGSIILKSVRGSGDETYDPNDLSNPPVGRLMNEWSAGRFLNGLNAPLSPRFYGANRELGFVLLEDLGEGECLADVLQGNDPARAREGLLEYASGMGRLHAASAGHVEEYRRIRSEIGAASSDEEKLTGKWLSEGVPQFLQNARLIEVEPHPGIREEASHVAEALDHPGPFLAFAPGDTCPDNHRLLPDGIRFFDFEFCGFRHALLDGAYLLAPFPTCWCVSRLPGDLPFVALDAYRQELVKRCPEAADDSTFHTAALYAHAYWVLSTLSWGFEKTLEEDNSWGLCSIRNRCLLRLDTLADNAERWNGLPAMGETARRMSEKLRERWGPGAEMPLYPPFRETVAAPNVEAVTP